jgi:hypothetical protein
MRFVAAGLASIAAIAIAGAITVGAAHALPRLDAPAASASAEAVHYMRGHKHRHKHWRKRHHGWPGHCGTYKYWHHMKCLDARLKK